MKQNITDNETQFMKDAYGMLYEIETKLKRIVITNLLNYYGSNWLLSRYESKLYLHDLIAYFAKYPQVLTHFSPLQLTMLRKLPTTRNKVAHAKLSTDDEFIQLKKCYAFVKRAPFSKRNNIDLSESTKIYAMLVKDSRLRR